MSRFQPKNPDFRHAATAVFDAQPAMRTLGISIARLDAGEVDLAMDYSAAFAQQNGFVHAGIITAGLDNACGIAAYTLMAPEAAILTVEFKTNLLAPAKGERFRVLRAGHQAGPHADGVRGARLRDRRGQGEFDRQHDRNADGADAARGTARESG